MHCITLYLHLKLRHKLHRKFCGFGTPDVVLSSPDALCLVLERLGLAISKKLLPPCTRVVSLGLCQKHLAGGCVLWHSLGVQTH